MEPKKINKRLEEYGKDIEGRPIYRLILADEQLEIHNCLRADLATFKDNDGRDKTIYLGEHVGIGRDEKYPGLSGRWILEKLVFQSFNPELPDRKPVDYEPLFVFDKNGEYLKPEWFAIEYIIHLQIHGARTTKQYFDELGKIEKQKRREAIAKTLGVDLNPSRVESAFAFKEAVAGFHQKVAL